MRKYHELDFEGIKIKVASEFDERCGKYIDDIPDLEEEPLYTPTGKLLVTAVQDQCPFAASDDAAPDMDCGSCRFYRPNHPGDLIGVCMNPETEKKH